MATAGNIKLEVDTLDLDKLSDVVTELTDAIERFSKALDRLEETSAIVVNVHGEVDPDIVRKLTDERFKSVTR